MLLNKILGKIIKISILENFSYIEVKFLSIGRISYRLYHTSTQWCGKHGTKEYTKMLTNNKTNKQKQQQERTRTHNC